MLGLMGEGGKVFGVGGCAEAALNEICILYLQTVSKMLRFEFSVVFLCRGQTVRKRRICG